MVSMDEEYRDYSWLKAVPAKDPYALTEKVLMDSDRIDIVARILTDELDLIVNLKRRVIHLELLVDPAVQEEYNEVTRG